MGFDTAAGAGSGFAHSPVVGLGDQALLEQIGETLANHSLGLQRRHSQQLEELTTFEALLEHFVSDLAHRLLVARCQRSTARSHALVDQLSQVDFVLFGG